jgi:uncharacterized protein YndB with AHSA1/START domain
MRRYETTIDINASPSQVWAVMSDLERWPEWTASMSEVVRTSSGTPGVGSTARVKQPKLAPANFVITAWNPERGFDWETRNALVSAVGHHAIEPTAGGSRVTLYVDFSGPLAGLVTWCYGNLTTRYVRIEAEGLKRRSEELARSQADAALAGGATR